MTAAPVRATLAGMRPLAAACLAAVLAVTAAPAARADDEGLDAQVLALRVGAWIPAGPSMAGLEPGPEGELTLGVRLLSWLGAEMGAGVARPSSTSAAVRDAAGVARTVEPRLWDVPVGGGLRAFLAAGPVELSAAAGVAVHFVSAERDVASSATTAVTTEKEEDASLGGWAAVAAMVPVGRHTSLGVEGRFTVLRPHLFGERQRLDAFAAGLRIAQGF
ncbi:conserved hypothetical protein [Anaeromyxobacter dehalogenans 2CP-1]|uniref:Outer membrane protein beta-barrel domain-containing protein n=2 Tax=Anaeromyxobacter dehalogenans TaxID=161493 RepID=B8J7J2_ANAD2|nr:conserved hypothetical protein [Anaeromyxobacter dehalogenans 2CP-1]